MLATSMEYRRGRAYRSGVLGNGGVVGAEGPILGEVGTVGGNDGTTARALPILFNSSWGAEPS